MHSYNTVPPRGGLKTKQIKAKPKPMMPKVPMGMINRAR